MRMPNAKLFEIRRDDGSAEWDRVVAATIGDALNAYAPDPAAGVTFCVTYVGEVLDTLFDGEPEVAP